MRAQWMAVIDDDDSLRKSIIRLLASADVCALGFESAEAFLAHAEGPPPACALVDLYLGRGLNGWELRERLERDGRAVPIIFMTAQAELPIRMQEDEVAVATCLRKPFAAEELFARLARTIVTLRDAQAPAMGIGG